MKIKLFPALIVLVTVSTAFTVVTDELHQAMTKMMQKMKSMKMTGNADYDFAIMMAEHHQGSIDMSEVIASSGKDEKIKNMAQSILDKQPKSNSSSEVIQIPVNRNMLREMKVRPVAISH